MHRLFVDVSEQPYGPTSNKSGLSATREEPRAYSLVPDSDISFPEFAYLKRLGRGSHGTVVEANYKGRAVAVKLMETDNDNSRIHHEANLLDKLKHEHIVKLFAFFHGERTGLVLELVEGGSLHELHHKRLHIQYFACHTLGWAQQVAAALSYIHGKVYLHRDIKPNNMLLTNDFITLKLYDFGTVAQLRSSMTDNRGTPAWMARKFRGRKYDQKCDIFSFGMSLWEIFARRQPFEQWYPQVQVQWQVSEGLRPPRVQECPAPIMELIERCWQDNPGDRPDVEEVVGIIDSLCEIYPNRKLPLVDKTTKQKAFANPAEQPWSSNCCHPFTVPAHRRSGVYSSRAATSIVANPA